MKQLTRRDFLKLGGLTLASLAFSRYVPQKDQTWFWDITYRLNTEQPIFALTIDDVASGAVLEDMLDVLSEYGIKADFFPRADTALYIHDHHKGIFERLVNDGHGIGYHTVNHPDVQVVRNAPYEWWCSDFTEWWRIFRAIFFPNVNLFYDSFPMVGRAPYGEFSANCLAAFRHLKMTPLKWSWTIEDFEKNGTLIQQGDIALLHVVNQDLAVLRELPKYVGIYNGNPVIPTSYSSYINPRMHPATEQQKYMKMIRDMKGDSMSGIKMSDNKRYIREIR